jgi:hypothetical protein
MTMSVTIRKTLVVVEETRLEDGRRDDPPLRKAAALAVIANPYAGRPFSDSLDVLVDASADLGRELGEQAMQALGTAAQSFGKAALVGLAGQQEHAVATITAVFGATFREAVGGGPAWVSSVSKRCAAGTTVDVPLACKDEIWVRSHYDAFTVTIPDAPMPDEIVVICAIASRGRMHARLGGMTRDEALARSGQ